MRAKSSRIARNSPRSIRNVLVFLALASLVIVWSTINTYIHLSILCYSLNSSQIELNYFTECLPYTAHPVTRTTRDHSDAIFLPVARFPRAGCVSNILSPNFSFFEFLEALPRRPTYPFQKNYCRNLILNVLIFAVCFRGTEKFAFLFRYFSYRSFGF